MKTEPQIMNHETTGNAKTSSLGVRIHDVAINVVCNNAKFIDYAQEHLGGLSGEPAKAPDIRVHCHWTVGEWEPEKNPFTTNGDLNIIGKRMLGKHDDLIWLNTLRMKGLKLRFRREDGQYIFDVHYCYHPKKGKVDHLPDYEYKRYFSLMSYAVYYPLFWYLEHFRDWTVLHASALDTGKGGVVVGGLGGIGKTTTSVGLIQHAKARLISENIIFTDGEKIFPCYEPIRLNEDSIEMLSDDFHGIRKMNFPAGLKDKSLYHINTSNLPASTKPASVFLPTFSPTRYLKEIAPELAAERLIAANQLTRELDDYYWYASALEMNWPQPGQARVRAEVLHKLAGNSRCFELGIDRNAGVKPVVEDIMATINQELS